MIIKSKLSIWYAHEKNSRSNTEDICFFFSKKLKPDILCEILQIENDLKMECNSLNICAVHLSP